MKNLPSIDRPNYKICIAKKTIIFYSLLAPVIIVGSLHNLIFGVVLHQNSVQWIGVFSLFGFVVLPLMIIATYRRKMCIIGTESIIIGKEEYAYYSHTIQLVEKNIRFVDRPLFSLFKSKYLDLVIIENASQDVVFEDNLDIFSKDVQKMKDRLPQV